MMKKLLFMLLLVSTVANSANREQRESRLVNEICSDVPSLTSVQTDSIAVAVSLYFTQWSAGDTSSRYGDRCVCIAGKTVYCASNNIWW